MLCHLKAAIYDKKLDFVEHFQRHLLLKTMWNMISDVLVADNTTNSPHNDTTDSALHNVPRNSSAPGGCYIVNFEEMEFLPWDSPDNIITAEVENIIRRIKDILIPIFFLIGGPANVISMAVFYKQGLKERVNLCLFALSLADELFLIETMLLFGEQIHVQFTSKERFGPVLRFMANNNLVCFFGFAWVSQIMSAIIASERCLCVLSPFRFQTLLRTRTMAVIIVVVFLVVVGFYFVMATRYRIACVFVPPAGTTFYAGVASEFYRKRALLINYLDGFVYGAGIPVVMITVVTTTTIITAVKVRQAAAWRAGTSSASGSSSSSSSSISPQELALTRMLIGISVLFIVCVAPLALFRVVWLFQPEMNLGRRYHNLFATGLSVLETLAYVNATFNIFVYYSIGTRYRKTFWALLGRLKQDKTERMPGITN